MKKRTPNIYEEMEKILDEEIGNRRIFYGENSERQQEELRRLVKYAKCRILMLLKEYSYKGKLKEVKDVLEGK
jgi:hypothetical protein